MRHSCIVLTLVMAAVALAADAPKPLEVTDRLQLREAQLTLAQAHIARLQAEAQIKDAEANIGQLVQNLKTQYTCQNCTLNNDFTWTRTPTPTATTKPSGATTPTPKERGGTNQKKE
jgi:hypothetical protein